MFKIKNMFMALAVSAFAVTTGVSLSTPADAADKIRMGSRLEYWDVNYRLGGFDKKYGLEAKPVPFSTGIEVITAIQSGEIDIASSGHVPMTILFSKTDKVIAVGVATFTEGSIYRMVVPKDSTAKSIDDLKGKIIATKIGSGSYNAFLNYLDAKGLDEKDFKVKNAGPGAIVAAMESGSVDAGIWFDPTISLILHRGLGRVLFDFDKHARAVGFWLVNRKFAEENPDIVVRFLAGAMDAQDMLIKDPKASAQNISNGYKVRGFDYSADVFLGGLPLFDFNWPIKDLHIDTVKNTYAFFKKKGRIKGDEPDWNNLFSTEFMKKAEAIRK